MCIRDRDHTVRQVYPLTNLQLYFAYVMRGNTTANLPFLYKLDERTDLRRLKFAVAVSYTHLDVYKRQHC